MTVFDFADSEPAKAAMAVASQDRTNVATKR
jgi:hypothetical protein